MSGTRIVQVLAAVALIGIAVLIMKTSHWETVTVRSPPQGEALTNRYYALEHLLAALGVHTREIHTLGELPPGSVLYVEALQFDFTHLDVRALESWVEGGGRLIVPSYVLWSEKPLRHWSAIDLVQREPSGAPRAARRVSVDPAVATVLAGGCMNWSARTRGQPTPDTLCMGMLPTGQHLSSHRTPLWSIASGNEIQMLRIAVDQGELAVIGTPAIIHNQALIKHDHARAWLGATGLRRGDTLLLLSPVRAETLPMLIWRLAAPAVVFLLLAVLALIVRHWPRFGPPEPDPVPARRSLAEQIHANGRFAWRTRRLDALRAAVSSSLEDLASGMSVGYRRLDRLAQAQQLARLTGLDTLALHGALTVAAGAPRRSQLHALAVLESARRALDRNLHSRSRRDRHE
jgi:hypothetical protein